MNYPYYFVLLCVLLGTPVHGQEELTLDGAIREALKQSPHIQNAEASVGETRWKKYESLAIGFFPKVSVSANHFLAKHYTYTGINFGGPALTFPGFYPTSQLSIDVSIPLFDGLANVRQLQAASLLEEASEKELTQAQFQLAQDVRLTFYQALAAGELQKVAEQNVKTLEDHLRQVKIQRHGGVATGYDALRVEVQLSEAQSEAIDSKDTAILIRKKLAQQLGLEHDDRPLSGGLPSPDPTRIRNLDLADVKERADIQALGLRATAADRLQSARGAWLIPSVALGGQYLLYNSQVFANSVVTDTGIYRSAYNVGVRLVWNLFNGGASFAQAKAAAYQTVQAEKASRAAQIQVPYDLAYWKKRYVANSQHYLSKKLDIARSEESVRLAKEEEKAGSRTASETLDALLDLFRAKAGVVNAQVNAIEAQIRLELALGRRT